MDSFTLTSTHLESLLFRAAGGEPVNDLLVELELDLEAERVPQAKH